MIALCGILKVNDFRKQTFDVHVIKYEENVDLTEKLMSYLQGLNVQTRLMIEDDIKSYIEHGPIDSIEIVIDSGDSRYNIVNNVVYKALFRYIQADRRVVRVLFKFYNRMQRCYYTDEEVSGDYLLIPVLCKTQNEEMAAVAWCRETIKSIIQKMYDKYGNKLTADDAINGLTLDESDVNLNEELPESDDDIIEVDDEETDGIEDRSYMTRIKEEIEAEAAKVESSEEHITDVTMQPAKTNDESDDKKGQDDTTQSETSETEQSTSGTVDTAGEAEQGKVREPESVQVPNIDLKELDAYIESEEKKLKEAERMAHDEHVHEKVVQRGRSKVSIIFDDDEEDSF